MSQPKRYVKRPVEVQAFKIEGYGDFGRARDWINENGGTAHWVSHVDKDFLAIVTIDGNIADVFDGWYVVRGIQGEFYSCRGDIFEASHSPVEEPVVPEPLTGTGLYVRPSPEGATRLVGGAAKQRPRADDGTPLRMDGTTGNWAGD